MTNATLHIANIRHPSFGEQLAADMARANLTAYELAQAVGIDRSLISRYVRMDRVPGRERAIRIARALHPDEDGQQKLLTCLGYLTPTYQRRLRASLWSDQ